MLFGSTFDRGNNYPDSTVLMASVPVYTNDCQHTVSSNAKSDANATTPHSPTQDAELSVAVNRFLPYIPSSLFEILSLYFNHKNSVVDITIKKYIKLTSVACV